MNGNIARNTIVNFHATTNANIRQVVPRQMKYKKSAALKFIPVLIVSMFLEKMKKTKFN
jgi:hypothetical protein